MPKYCTHMFYFIHFLFYSMITGVPVFFGYMSLMNSGMLVVSSSEPDPVEQFLKLSQEQHRIQHSSEYSYPKWFIPNTLKYYVLLHDVSTGEEQRWVICLQ